MAFCAALLKGVSRFAVKYTHLAVLEETSIVAALAEKTGTLAALHRRIAEVYGSSLNEWTGSDEVWLPHTTLLYDPKADLPAVCRKMAADFAPFTAGIVGIEFSRVTPPGCAIDERNKEKQTPERGIAALRRFLRGERKISITSAPGPSGSGWLYASAPVTSWYANECECV